MGTFGGSLALGVAESMGLLDEVEASNVVGGVDVLVDGTANVTVFFAGTAGTESCLTFSLSFAMAAASRSCFSHLE